MPPYPRHSAPLSQRSYRLEEAACVQQLAGAPALHLVGLRWVQSERAAPVQALAQALGEHALWSHSELHTALQVRQQALQHVGAGPWVGEANLLQREVAASAGARRRRRPADSDDSAGLCARWLSAPALRQRRATCVASRLWGEREGTRAGRGRRQLPPPSYPPLQTLLDPEVVPASTSDILGALSLSVLIRILVIIVVNNSLQYKRTDSRAL